MRNASNQTRWPLNIWDSRGCGRMAFPVTCRSCWCRVKAAEDELSFVSLFSGVTYTRRRGMELDLVVLDERAGEPGEADRGRIAQRSRQRDARQAGRHIYFGCGISLRRMMQCCSRQPHALCWGVDAGRWPLSSNIVSTRRRPNRNCPCARLQLSPLRQREAAGRVELLERYRRIYRRWSRVRDGNRRRAAGGPALPPAPWTNVLGNPGFGCLVTEAGLGYSWAGNSQMNRLTPWSNDPFRTRRRGTLSAGRRHR